MNNPHHIPLNMAVAEFRSMVRCLNESRFGDSVPHARRLHDWGLPQHPQPGKSLAAREAAAAEKSAAPPC